MVSTDNFPHVGMFILSNSRARVKDRVMLGMITWNLSDLMFTLTELGPKEAEVNIYSDPSSIEHLQPRVANKVSDGPRRISSNAGVVSWPP